MERGVFYYKLFEFLFVGSKFEGLVLRRFLGYYFYFSERVWEFFLDWRWFEFVFYFYGFCFVWRNYIYLGLGGESLEKVSRLERFSV